MVICGFSRTSFHCRWGYWWWRWVCGCSRKPVDFSFKHEFRDEIGVSNWGRDWCLHFIFCFSCCGKHLHQRFWLKRRKRRDLEIGERCSIFGFLGRAAFEGRNGRFSPQSWPGTCDLRGHLPDTWGLGVAHARTGWPRQPDPALAWCASRCWGRVCDEQANRLMTNSKKSTSFTLLNMIFSLLN